MSDAPVSSAPDRRPMVGRAVSDRGMWMFAAIAVIGGGVLFSTLESRRATISAPSVANEVDDAGSVIAPPPELTLPQTWQGPSQIAPAPLPAAPITTPTPVVETPRRFARDMPQYAPPTTMAGFAASPPVPIPQTPAVVFSAQGGGPGNANGAKPDIGLATKSERVEATRFANPMSTVPKGTVLQAVLESALDSTRAGMARAIISRDIYGFDGTRVLIPRGSRLIGDYKADVQQGQNRALIEWQRLMRPDGVLINLDSPSADPLGRAGIRGKVNSHFFARYSGAILQTALNVGEQVAVNKLAPAETIYESPALLGAQGTSGVAQPNVQIGQNIQPTLTVKQGTSVSVFVARDLDFTSVEH